MVEIIEIFDLEGVFLKSKECATFIADNETKKKYDATKLKENSRKGAIYHLRKSKSGIDEPFEFPKGKGMAGFFVQKDMS